MVWLDYDHDLSQLYHRTLASSNLESRERGPMVLFAQMSPLDPTTQSSLDLSLRPHRQTDIDHWAVIVVVKLVEHSSMWDLL